MTGFDVILSVFDVILSGFDVILSVFDVILTGFDEILSGFDEKASALDEICQFLMKFFAPNRHIDKDFCFIGVGWFNRLDFFVVVKIL